MTALILGHYIEGWRESVLIACLVIAALDVIAMGFVLALYERP